jgi:hypothetical protein
MSNRRAVLKQSPGFSTEQHLDVDRAGLSGDNRRLICAVPQQTPNPTWGQQTGKIKGLEDLGGGPEVLSSLKSWKSCLKFSNTKLWVECDCHHGTHWAEGDQNTPAGSNSLNKHNVLHRATLINVALHPVYNPVFMALLVEPQHTAELHKEVLSSFGPSKWIGKPNKRGDWQWRNGFQQAWKWEAWVFHNWQNNLGFPAELDPENLQERTSHPYSKPTLHTPRSPWQGKPINTRLPH